MSDSFKGKCGVKEVSLGRSEVPRDHYMSDSIGGMLELEVPLEMSEVSRGFMSNLEREVRSGTSSEINLWRWF